MIHKKPHLYSICDEIKWEQQSNISRINMNKKSSIKRGNLLVQRRRRQNLWVQLMFDFDSQTLARVLVAFDHFAAADPVHEDQCVSIKMTKREYLDNAIRFSMGEWVTGNGDGVHLPRLQLVHDG